MKSQENWLLFFVILCISNIANGVPLEATVFSSSSLVFRTTTPVSPPGLRSVHHPSPIPHNVAFRNPFMESNREQDILDAFSTSSKEKKPDKPEVKSLNVVSKISYRYANTKISSRMANPADVAQQVFFSVVLPETAFISGFVMEIDDKSYTAYVKEKEEAQKVYDQAVSQGHTAAQVKQSARDSNRFSVSVNIEPRKKVTFNLMYEELLKRELGVYKHVINLNPGQIVEDFTVDVFIKEERNITRLRAPAIQSGNEIDPELENKDNDLADVEWISPKEAKVSFHPSVKDQKLLQKKEESPDYYPTSVEKTEGLSGQFAVEYDVVRDPSGGEVLINDGYFVHFFAPTELPPLRKHVLFVLDVSGSMAGRKIEQLREAMTSILSELHPDDYFNIIEFSYSVTVRNLDTAADSAVYPPYHHAFNRHHHFYDDTEFQPNTSNETTHPFPATPEYIQKAKEVVKKMTAGGGTNIHDALRTAIEIAQKGVNKPNKSEEIKEDHHPKPEPMIVFLTDGEPTVGITHLHKITASVNEFNRSPKTPIFSLAFGEGADFKFLKKISLANNGFARQIYEAGDASWQLRNFYNQISSPLLSNVSFVYPPDQIDEESLTKKTFYNLFGGSELVVSGKIKRSIDNVAGRVQALSLSGFRDYNVTDIDFIPISPTIPVENPTKKKNPSPLERLWAYMTIRQLLDDQEITKSSNSESKPTPKEQALALALKYSFVCPLTSLVVVKPTGASNVDTESAKPNSAVYASAAQPMTLTRLAFVPHSYNKQLFVAQKFAGPPGAPAPALIPASPMLIFGGSQRYYTTPRIYTTGAPSSGFTSHKASYPAPDPVAFEKSDEADSFDETTEPQTTTASTSTTSSTSTTTSTTTAVPPVLTLDSITWLPSVRNDNQIILENENKTKVPYLLDLSEPNVPHQSCQRPNGTTGVCRHLRHCVIEEILLDVTLYSSNYLCVIPGNFAGICCPEKKADVSEPTIRSRSSEETTVVDATTATSEITTSNADVDLTTLESTTSTEKEAITTTISTAKDEAAI